jgi:hypothetical protein
MKALSPRKMSITHELNLEIPDMNQFWKQPVLKTCISIVPVAMLVTLGHLGSAQAATGPGQCASSSRDKTISCCDKLYAKHKPAWMTGVQSSCRAAVSCSTSIANRAKRRCVISPPNSDYNSKDQSNSKRGQISDIRLKADIHRVGTTVFGLPLYQFEYRNKLGPHYIGVMAQDVLKVKPEAVSIGADGFYRVNYDMLGISMLKVQ